MASSTPPVRETRVALLAGATGLVGGFCLRRLLHESTFDKVVAVARRPLDLTHDRLMTIVTPFDALEQVPPVKAIAAFSTLGTTISKAGSKEAFRKVDHDAVLAFARWAKSADCRTFVLVSSVGADPKARTFYLKIKGEVEEAIARLGFYRLVILRPSVLMGERPERRPGEAIAQIALRAMNPILLGPLRRYRAVPAEKVARAMATAASGHEDGHFIWHDDEIGNAARAPSVG